ncbi:MAG: YbjN domain-containing protein [Deltaproteobacteria bacterium]|jgi:hypothetical protein|nr:YbjN domain-containing protein [Deltaproteobacteria bacterium]
MTNHYKITSFFLAAFLIVAFTAFGTNAQGQSDRVYNTITINQLYDLMVDQDYEVKVSETESNTKVIIWELNGKVAVLRLGKNSDDIIFYTIFGESSRKITVNMVNKWNQDKRFSRSYLDTDNDPILELDLDLEGGVTQERIIKYLRTCVISHRTWIRELQGDS